MRINSWSLGVKKKGFTFIELMLVVITVGIILGFSIPLFRRTLINLQLENLTQSIAKLMKYGQERAIVERARYRINFDFDEGKYWLTMESDSLSPTKFQKVGGRFGRIYEVPNGISIEGTENKLTFYPDGRADKLSIYLTNQSQTTYTLTTQKNIWGVRILEGRQESEIESSTRNE